ncbi:hypothetical protein RF55_26039 [Lasius niger]|uniref:Uncharacterized protein n=1 Tax=Lasius niger TaxID=67767 RepID=A0A0J7JUK3_LASNI|nr:hypothetical protein RF55_26039 [Lasius niger]
MQEEHGAPAEPVGGSAGPELGDAIVLAAKGDEAADGGGVAALDVSAEELTALGEAEGVDGGSRGENGMGGESGADGGELDRQVAEERGGAVGVGVGVEDDGVNKGSGMDGLGEGADPLHALTVGRIAQAVPDDERKGRVVAVVGAAR